MVANDVNFEQVAGLITMRFKPHDRLGPDELVAFGSWLRNESMVANHIDGPMAVVPKGPNDLRLIFFHVVPDDDGQQRWFHQTLRRLTESRLVINGKWRLGQTDGIILVD